MNYKHVYHAGNFADAFKHSILTALMQSFARKDAGFCYIDTHAGKGYYDLFSDSAKKTKEAESGIEKIIHESNPPFAVKRYLNCVHEINNKLSASKYASLHYYPGSPMIARQLLRPQDSMIACELHPDEYQSLKNTFAGDKQVAIHHNDGFLGLKAFLPPKERRGFVLIDPPYEDPDEFTRIAHSLPAALKRFETGTYAIWYPIKDNASVERFYRTLQQLIDHTILAVELTIYPDLPNHLNGSGIVIINPPYQFEDTLRDILPWLWKALTINEQGHFRVRKLK